MPTGFVGDDVRLDACEYVGSLCAIWRGCMAVAEFPESQCISIGARRVGRCPRAGRDAYAKPCGDCVLERVTRVSRGTRTCPSETVRGGSEAGGMCRGE